MLAISTPPTPLFIKNRVGISSVRAVGEKGGARRVSSSLIDQGRQKTLKSTRYFLIPRWSIFSYPGACLLGLGESILLRI